MSYIITRINTSFVTTGLRALVSHCYCYCLRSELLKPSFVYMELNFVRTQLVAPLIE